MDISTVAGTVRYIYVHDVGKLTCKTIELQVRQAVPLICKKFKDLPAYKKYPTYTLY